MGTAGRTFARFAEPGQQRVDQEKLRSDIEKLVEGTRLVKDFRNQWIAHFDEKREIEQMPTFADVDRALDIIDEVWCEYEMLLTCSSPPTRKPALQPDWEEPLRHRWIEGPEQEKG